jgi:hypothetical protein
MILQLLSSADSDWVYSTNSPSVTDKFQYKPTEGLRASQAGKTRRGFSPGDAPGLCMPSTLNNPRPDLHSSPDYLRPPGPEIVGFKYWQERRVQPCGVVGSTFDDPEIYIKHI